MAAELGGARLLQMAAAVQGGSGSALASECRPTSERALRCTALPQSSAPASPP